jgi:hypothetical protein
MRQASLKFKRYAQGVAVIQNDGASLVLRMLLGAFCFVALWYILILGNIVFNIVERKTVEGEIRTLSSEVNNLELEYLALSNNIDLDLSYKLGFREVKAGFATRKTFSSLGSLKLVQNDI